MKELSIEEKAKRYDEAIAKGKQIQNTPYTAHWDIMKEVVEHLLPELKESEDERIVNALIGYIEDSVHDVNEEIIPGIKISDAIAWLEKQGEHARFIEAIQVGDQVTKNENGVLVNLSQLKRVAKPSEQNQSEQKPKFRVGDTIKKKSTGDIVTVSEIDLKNREYRLSNTGFIPFKYEYLWELVEQKPADKVEPKFKVGDKVKSIIDGFECTIESIDNTCYYGDTTNFDIQDQDDWELVEQKPAEWTHKDGKKLAELWEILSVHRNTNSQVDNLMEWVKDLVSYKRQEWSEEDIVAIDCAVEVLRKDLPSLAASIERLKSLRPQNTWKPSDEHYELEEFAKIVRGNLTGISKAVQKLFEAKYLQLTGNKMYGGFKD